MSKPQFSKRERGKKNTQKGSHREPTYGWCSQCGDAVWNKGAHAEVCTGQPRLRCESYTYSAGAFGVRKQCVRPWSHSGGHIY